MRSLHYIPLINSAGKKLREIIEFHFSERTRDICHTIDELTVRLRQPGLRPDVTVLFPSDAKSLDEILAIRPLFCDQRIILVLPDTVEDLAEKALGLHPRYLTYATRGFIDVPPVLRKIILKTRLQGLQERTKQ
ncbi:MAG: hypothetical protein GY859_42190 [Desulfobacterales bacterium]|nr:hypothetical protein [Desulfobacterales bacterium]